MCSNSAIVYRSDLCQKKCKIDAPGIGTQSKKANIVAMERDGEEKRKK
jgi:hypothetical protein